MVLVGDNTISSLCLLTLALPFAILVAEVFVETNDAQISPRLGKNDAFLNCGGRNVPKHVRDDSREHDINSTN